MKLLFHPKLTAVTISSAMTLALFGANPAQAITFTSGNLLVSTDEVVYEYTTNGELVQSIPVPYPDILPSTESARDIVVDSSGKLHVYNSTFDPFLSTFDVSSEEWSHLTYPGWSTVNNVSYGGIATFQDKVFVTDMRTFGDNGADEAKGIVVFDQTSGVSSRFAEDIEPIDLNLGLDGLLYALYPGGSPGGRRLDVYNPATLEKVREIDLVASLGFGVDRRSIAVNASGDLFVASWAGQLFHLNSEGTLLDTLNLKCKPLSFNLPCSLYDVDISSSGTIVLGSRFGDVLVTDESFSNVQSFLVGQSGTFVSIVPEAEPVPEPLMILGSATALAFGALLKREHSKKNNKS